MGNCIAFCFCSALTSICSGCCGTEKPSSVPPSAKSGRVRSIGLLLLSIALALAFQYGVAPVITTNESFLWDTWGKDCEQYIMDDLVQTCVANSGVFRVASCAFLFFALSSVIALCKPTANREAWCAKYVLFVVGTIATIVIPSDPLFNPIMLNVFRIGSTLFVIGQTIIILDAAYNLNDSWVEKANKADREEGDGAGNKWLVALLCLCGTLFIASIVGIGFMFVHFSGCSNNMAFIVITLILGVLCTVIQLTTGEESSLCTSAAVFAYATYLCYTAVSKNPHGECNPQLGDNDALGIFLGLAITVMSLVWVGYSSTSYSAVGDESANNEPNNEEAERTQQVTGVRIGDASEQNDDEEKEEEGEEGRKFSNSWKLNLILTTVCCWYAMSLTSWGSIEDGGNSANPSAGRISMWMIIASQWLMYLMYLWTLSASRLLPDRDFS